MDEAKDAAKLISLMSSYGYASVAVEYAAIHALNSASTYRGDRRRRAIEDALIDLVAAGAVFDISSTYRVSLWALPAIDLAARSGVELSVQDAVRMVTENENA